VVHAFLANIQTTRQLRLTYPKMRMKYPWRIKRFYPVNWPAQAQRQAVELQEMRFHWS
jgi:putative transposase